MKQHNFYIFILTVLLGFTSCRNTVKAKFEIINESNQTIDSLFIEPNSNVHGKYISVNPNETKVYLIDMSTIPRIDGSYNLTFKVGKVTIVESFGYYTNGYPLEKLTVINIWPDSVKFNFIIKSY